MEEAVEALDVAVVDGVTDDDWAVANAAKSVAARYVNCMVCDVVGSSVGHDDLFGWFRLEGGRLTERLCRRLIL